MNSLFRVKKLNELTNTAGDNCSCIKDCYRGVVLSDLAGNEEYKIVLTGDDAQLPLAEGQFVLADLQWDYFPANGEWRTEYYATNIKPIENICFF